MEAKEYIVEELTYPGYAGESKACLVFFPTFEEALKRYEETKSVIGEGCFDSFVRIYIRHGNNAYLLRDYCPNSQSRIYTYYKGYWKGCEMVRDESELKF